MPHAEAERLYECGLAHCRAREYAKAEPFLLAALAIDDEFPIAWHDLGGVFVKTRRFDLAERAVRRAIALDDHFPESHFMLAGVLLALGAWHEGWTEFEWRFACRQTAPVELDLPYWRGEDVRGKRLLLVADQGFGDTLQFIRCAALLHDLGAELSIWGPEPTTPLLARLPYIAHAQTYIQNIPPVDYYLPLLSLPYMLGLSVDALPAPPYLYADRHKTAAFRERLGPRKEQLRIALAWAGRPAQRDNATRSMPLETLAPLLRDPTFRWLSVQQGEARAELTPFADCVEDWSDELSSFDDSAALFRAVDGVISVCSAPIHLAGALNGQSIALLSTEADWRWGTHEPASPWYPRTQLARQTAAGDWASLVPQIRRYLAGWQIEDALPTICGESGPTASVGIDRHEWLYV